MSFVLVESKVSGRLPKKLDDFDTLVRVMAEQGLELKSVLMFYNSKKRTEKVDPITGEVVTTTLRPYIILTKNKVVACPKDQIGVTLIKRL